MHITLNKAQRVPEITIVMLCGVIQPQHHKNRNRL